MKTISMYDLHEEITRSMRLQDTSYEDDIFDWMFDAMQDMETTMALVNKKKKIKIRDYVACLPKGFNNISLLEFNRQKVREGNPVPTYDNFNEYANTGFASVANSSNIFELSEDQYIDGKLMKAGFYKDIYTNAENKIYRTGYDEIAMFYFDTFHSHCYTIKGGLLQTTLKEGEMDLYYEAYPTDDKGYPLILSQVNYRRAIYFYVVRQMMDSGFKHPLYGKDYREVHQLYIEARGEALRKINFITPDRMEGLYQAYTRLIPVKDAWHNNFKQINEPETLFTNWSNR